MIVMGQICGLRISQLQNQNPHQRAQKVYTRPQDIVYYEAILGSTTRSHADSSRGPTENLRVQETSWFEPKIYAKKMPANENL